MERKNTQTELNKDRAVGCLVGGAVIADTHMWIGCILRNGAKEIMMSILPHG